MTAERESLIASLPNLSDEDFVTVVEALDDECIRRGWPCCPWLPPIHEHHEATA